MKTPYIELCEDILANGEERTDRTGTGTLSLFSRQLRFDLQKGFPAVTEKKLAFKTMIAELIFFLKGKTDINWLHRYNCRIWDEWADEFGDLGPVYGAQWRYWWCESLKYDQIKSLVDSLKNDPQSRRHIVSAWNVGDIDDMALPPCHLLFQCYVRQGKYLDLQLTQRSADVFLGLPFNIASYATLTHILAQCTGLEVGELIICVGDAHIYSNHIEQVKTMCANETYPLPTLKIHTNTKDVDEFEPHHFTLEGYQSHPTIKGDISV